MVRPDQETLSAYIDGEVAPPFAESIARAIERDPVTAQRYRRLLEIQRALPRMSPEQIDASAARSWNAVQHRIHHQAVHSVRTVAVPLPGLAAAAVALVVLAGALVWSLVATPSIPAERLLADHGDVDVTIQLANGEMEQVLSWLADQDLLGEVSIELPEQQFSIVGEPVLVKSASYPGDGQR